MDFEGYLTPSTLVTEKQKYIQNRELTELDYDETLPVVSKIDANLRLAAFNAVSLIISPATVSAIILLLAKLFS